MGRVRRHSRLPRVETFGGENCAAPVGRGLTGPVGRRRRKLPPTAAPTANAAMASPAAWSRAKL